MTTAGLQELQMLIVQSSGSSCQTSRRAQRQTSPACRNRGSIATIHLSNCGVLPDYGLFSKFYFLAMYILAKWDFNQNVKFKKLRRKFNINGAAELITDESGESLYLVARSRNQFLTNREMLLGYLFDWKAPIRFLHIVMRFIHFVPFLCQTIFKPFFMSTHLMIFTWDLNTMSTTHEV